jgi:hypothetical protein
MPTKRQSWLKKKRPLPLPPRPTQLPGDPGGNPRPRALDGLGNTRAHVRLWLRVGGTRLTPTADRANKWASTRT